ncbi:19431_t:CDS:2 [Dentiscutata erythropus]|uniref:19431_t:CDS:1 n=1 Tax=Dentiscutata erythropus TaxID=1348616 RepID=A0A9N9B1P3_9GLOM|nr:19431_t:CDS:2 [Dentiscutata erythropus]
MKQSFLQIINIVFILILQPKISSPSSKYAVFHLSSQTFIVGANFETPYL